MALTRRMLKAMGIEDEKIDQIIEAHAETVDALKHERDTYKEDAEALPAVKEELERLKSAPSDGFKEKWEKEHEDFEAYKAKVEEDRAKAEKASLYRSALQEAGVDSKRIDSVMRVADLSALAVKDGQIEDRDKVIEGIKSEWGDFIVQTSQKPASVQTPPANTKSQEKEPHSIAEAMRLELENKQ